MRKMMWAIPLIASMSGAAVIGPALTETAQALAAVRTAHHATIHNVASKWMKIDKAHKTVMLKVIADATSDNGGFNFNGYSKGAMQVHVPKGWTVKVTFQNDSPATPHSLLVVPYAQRNQDSGFTLAFMGSSIPMSAGITSGMTEAFHFKATKNGTFAMICGVPGHSDSAGMWDTLSVSNKFKLPAIVVKSGNPSSSGAASGKSSSSGNTGWGSTTSGSASSGSSSGGSSSGYSSSGSGW